MRAPSDEAACTEQRLKGADKRQQRELHKELASAEEGGIMRVLAKQGLPCSDLNPGDSELFNKMIR